MLVLTRRKDESLVIDDQIIITILAVEGEKVKIGITAPRNISILRQELWQAMNEQRHVAEQTANGTALAGLEEQPGFLTSETADEKNPEDPKLK